MPPVSTLKRSYLRDCRARGLAEATIKTYDWNLAILVGQTNDPDIKELSRSAMRDFFAERAQTGIKPATASITFRVVHRFLVWCVEEEELTSSPLDRVRGPRVPAIPVPMPTEAEVKSLLQATGNDHSYRGRRDLCILLLLLDTGGRRGEIAALRTEDINLERNSVCLNGKTGPRTVRLNAPGVILVHNHPSGDPTPSPDDLHLTAEALAAGRPLDIDVLDHIVVAGNAFVSLRDRGVKFDRPTRAQV